MTSHVVSDDELGWHEAEVAGRPRTSICSMVSAHAASRPDRPAVIDPDGRHLTYRELQRRSGGLAVQLAADGVGLGSCVGVFLERSSEFVVAAYAVMRAGAAYLPLDVATPQDRLEFVLSDAGAEAVISDGRELPAGPWRTIQVDEPIAVPDAHPGLDRSAPDDLAYVIYTSGSTGRPKGVELTHANLTNLVDWHVSAFGVVPTDRASQVASVGFDAAVWEIWPHLAAGAAVCITDEATRRSPQLLRDWLVAEKITIAFAPTVLAEQLIHLAWPAGTALRTLLTGADVLHRRPAAGLPFALVNNYGPTECTVVATSGTVDPAQGDDTPSIGRPIGDTAALVLDGSLQPVAPGDAGELCLTGTLVGRGYRNDPELTASRFVTLHRDAGPPLRVYRTGDQVRLLDNGEVAFLGRLDRQIKLRGFRIEPAEIVTALDRAGGVAASAVVARGEPDGEPELVAYVVPAEGASPTTAELRHVLAARLPDYMVPATFVGLDSLPLTLHGKLDEGALPAPSPERLLPGQPTPAPDTAGGSIEDQVGGMVQALLELPAVDVRANIFLLGGHSMLAMQLVSRIHQVFGVKLPLRQLFDEPTVSGISAAVARRMPADRAEARA
jgi:amino acid adenylation domain-containing protein